MLRAGLLAAGAFILVGAFAPWLSPHDPYAYVALPLLPPSPAHLLGTNDVGQDILSQLIAGTRVSVIVGLAAGTISTAISWALGLLSGVGKGADALVTGAADLMVALPLLPLIILLAAYLRPTIPIVIMTLGLVTWGPFARIIRGEVQRELRKPYVEAARAVGSSRWRTLFHHVGPATVSTAVAKFVMTVQYAVVAQASLAFLGLGDPSLISWGDIVHRASQSPLIFLDGSWLWWLLPPALATAALVVAFALIGWSVEERRLPRGAGATVLSLTPERRG